MSVLALRETLLNRADTALLFDLYGRVSDGKTIVQRVDRLAGALLAAVGPRATIGLWSQNAIATVESHLAVQWIAGTRVTVDPSASAQEAAATFRAAGADCVLVDAAHDRFAGLKTLGHDDDAPLAGGAATPIEPAHPSAPALIYPRAVIDGKLFGITLSYGNWWAMIIANMRLFQSGGYGEWDAQNAIFLATQQIMHATGMVGSFPFLSMGLPQVIMDNFDPPRALNAIKRHRITSVFAVPAMLNALVKAGPNAGDCQSLRHILYGGGPISYDEILAAITRFGPVLSQLYGRVEAGWPISILSGADHAAILRGDRSLSASCGRPVEGVQIRLRDLNDGKNNSGELQVKAPTCSAEYTGTDGWCAVGDVMTQDAKGYLFYQKRLDRMINTGYHVYPDEIEAALIETGLVGSVLVRGEAHARWGQMVVAYVVPMPGESPDDLQGALKAKMSARLAKYKVPRVFNIVDDLSDVVGRFAPSGRFLRLVLLLSWR